MGVQRKKQNNPSYMVKDMQMDRKVQDELPGDPVKTLDKIFDCVFGVDR